MKYEAERGYLIPAFNNSTTDYVQCAIVLAKSIKQWHPDAKICLLTDSASNSHPIFDFVRLLPFPSTDKEWKLDNDWQVFWASPFHETIKLEADMLVTSPIDHWWTLFRTRDVWISTGARDLYNGFAVSRRYRQTFDVNKLPDAYNAITYWRTSLLAKTFFTTVRQLFQNWDVLSPMFKFTAGEELTTDVAYAIAMVTLGEEKFTTPGVGPSIVHMKPAIIQTTGDNWESELVWEIDHGQVRINGVTQTGLLHYHGKHLAQEFDKYYG